MEIATLGRKKEGTQLVACKDLVGPLREQHRAGWLKPRTRGEDGQEWEETGGGAAVRGCVSLLQLLAHMACGALHGAKPSSDAVLFVILR